MPHGKLLISILQNFPLFLGSFRQNKSKLEIIGFNQIAKNQRNMRAHPRIMKSEVWCKSEWEMNFYIFRYRLKKDGKSFKLVKKK